MSDGSGTAQAPAVERARERLEAVRGEIAKAVVGHRSAVTGMLLALVLRGHVLVEGVPGTAKTLLVKALAASLHLDDRRVQFTPDLMPSDVTGQLIFDQDEGSFRFREGPVFTNLLLADEVNRTPPKTQAALLEAMEERQVTVEGHPRRLPDPFMVVGTQNPVEHEGTYPLPEAQTDRFLLKVIVGYPDPDAEREVLGRHLAGADAHDLDALGLEPVAGPDELEAARQGVRRVAVEQPVIDYVVALAGESRRSPSLALGVSPRGTTMLLAVARAWAWLQGSAFLTPDHVKEVAPAALRHRLVLRPEVELEGQTVDGVLDGLLAAVPVPR